MKINSRLEKLLNLSYLFYCCRLPGHNLLFSLKHKLPALRCTSQRVRNYPKLMELAIFYHRPRPHCQKLTEKGRKIEENRTSDFGGNPETTRDKMNFFKLWSNLYGSDERRIQESRQKTKYPPSQLKRGVFSKNQNGIELLLSGRLFGRTCRLRMLFITNAMRARTGPVTADARDRKSQQHKNHHQFFH